MDQGDLPKDKLPGYYASEIAGIFRTVRFGIAEAHGRAEIMEFNYYSERGVVARDTASGRYVIDLDRMPEAVAALAKELLEQEATGDRSRVEAWFAKYGTVPPELAKALEAASGVPVDIDPISSFPEPMRLDADSTAGKRETKMANQKPQCFENHARQIPAFAIGQVVLMVNLVGRLIALRNGISFRSVMDVLVGAALIVLFGFARNSTLAVQDRVIRLEMRLRLAGVLPPGALHRVSPNLRWIN